MGGDRFFPDATATATTIGRNVVRVRATVEGAAIGDGVWFRSFDVDDPSDLGYANRFRNAIDPNDKQGNDNRGRLDSDHEPAGSVRPDSSGKTLAGSGRLRAVGEGNALGAWKENGKPVKAIVKPLTNAAGQWIDAAGNVVPNAADAQRVAEVDLATTFAPGDNFRVGATVHKAGFTDENYEKAMEKFSPHDVPAKGTPQSIPDAVKFSPQLAIWRHLWIEDDCTSNIRGLMTSGTQNRQQNRFADAFLEPSYLPAATGLAAITVDVHPRTAKLSQNGDDAIWAARDSKDVESAAYWVVYIGNSFTRSIDVNPGFTVNATSTVTGQTQTNAFQASIVFSPNLARDSKLTNPALLLLAEQKVAVHEIGHQLMHDADHPGNAADILAYLRQSAVRQQDPGNRQRVNIMNEDAIAVPMNNPTQGQLDLYYFSARDIAEMRLRTNSPGKPD
jgi:nitrogen fixation protein FixH